jgi:hypothetical protein
MENLTTPATLSAAAQAVLDAFTEDNSLHDWKVHIHHLDALAAALRAVAERNEYKPDMRDEMEVMFSEGWNSHRKELLAIADELEGAN